ncbi:hypothetical protein BJ138DRAFT_587711 [Hygrophoropsis aurantiaca]|uniref:Uncharacterized protein n=2 Tax=Hygrophoropsis aurantiaca TaxID=72124 RepID=A0ACB7ZZ55_9AGAM|nr:hypothetical protein BJ138DRAFT_1183122 [Hygrophoropsis aurantiaca]KAH7906761.1 hypothetical protein BJ138DRAFT_587711 [Hygrophoropsis aurantiaca]
MDQSSFPSGSYNRLVDIAKSSFSAMDDGGITIADISHDLAAKINFSSENTRYYHPDMFSGWAEDIQTRGPSASVTSIPEISVLEISTIDGARLLSKALSTRSASFGRIAVLNFANALNPGGGVLVGAQAQEESLARSSTLYPCLLTDTAKKFYNHHRTALEVDGFYSHAMVYSPSVVTFKDDTGTWIDPFEMDVLTSAAVNAFDVRASRYGTSVPREQVERRIADVMKERMARILFLFEKQGAKNIVLGSYGTGAFQNHIELVAQTWADLLKGERARYRHSFHRVVFAVLGRETFVTFKHHFETH